MKAPDGFPNAPVQDFILLTVPVQYERLSEIAARHQMTVQELILRAVDEYVLRLEGQPKQAVK